jgi:hypothetical protein
VTKEQIDASFQLQAWLDYSEKIRICADSVLDKYCESGGRDDRLDDALEGIFQLLNPQDEIEGILMRAKQRTWISQNVPDGFVYGSLSDEDKGPSRTSAATPIDVCLRVEESLKEQIRELQDRLKRFQDERMAGECAPPHKPWPVGEPSPMVVRHIERLQESLDQMRKKYGIDG